MIKLPSFLASAAFWSALAGAAATVCGALGYAHEGTAVNAAIIAIGGVFIAIGALPVATTQQQMIRLRKTAELQAKGLVK